MKYNYNSDYITIIHDNSNSKTKEMEKSQKLQIEFYSVLIGNYLKEFGKSPKNPCLEEYQLAIDYYETLINQNEGKLKDSQKSLEKL